MGRQKVAWTEEVIAQIQARIAGGESIKAIAASLGVTRQRLYEVVPDRPPRNRTKVGDQFGAWTVIADAGLDRWRCRHLLCRCNCGTERQIQAPRLRSGDSQSCGCLNRGLNHSCARAITIDGRTQSRSEWVQELGIAECTVSMRIKKGLSIEEALTRPRQAGLRLDGQPKRERCDRTKDSVGEPERLRGGQGGG